MNTVLFGILGILIVILVFLPKIAGRSSLEDTRIRWGRHLIHINLRRLLAGAIILLSLIVAALNFLP